MSNEELVQLYQNGDKKALEELIQANTGIIHKIANKYNGISRELEFDDLFQSGVLGLINAVEKYNCNHEKKAKFITYAIFLIDRYIYCCVNGRGSKEIENNKFYNSCTSLNAPIGEDETGEVIDFIEGVDYGFENIEEKIFLQYVGEDADNGGSSDRRRSDCSLCRMEYGWAFFRHERE